MVTSTGEPNSFANVYIENSKALLPIIDEWIDSISPSMGTNPFSNTPLTKR